MPSPRSRWLPRALLALMLGAGGGAALALEPEPSAHPAAPDIAQIQSAMDQVNQDPLLGTERKIRSLRWKSDGKSEPETTPGWVEWLQDLFSWIGHSARLIVWVLAGTLAAVILVYVVRLLRTRTGAVYGKAFVAPSHVQDLDIRPESLPDDIGAAALALWERGEHRRALALLYRGLLSRMVHAHGAPVRDSTTEGECIVLARRCLPAAAGEFSALLVATWQRAVYGELLPATEQVRALCAGFAPSLDPPATGAAAR